MYQPYQQTNYQQPYQQRMNNITWVQGVEGAKAYQLSPNTNVQLMDSENDGIFYIKTSDNIGMCNLRVFKYEEIKETPNNAPQVDMSMYVTKEELENALAKIKGGLENEQPLQSTKQHNKNVITK